MYVKLLSNIFVVINHPKEGTSTLNLSLKNFKSNQICFRPVLFQNET